MVESIVLDPDISHLAGELTSDDANAVARRIQESFGLTPDSYTFPPEDKVFTGFHGEPVPVEVRDRHDGQWKEIVYVRIGDRIFIDRSFTDKIPNDLRLYVGRNIVPLFALHASTLARWADSYEPPFINAIESVEFESKGFLELGSADAVACLLAHIRGAGRIIAVDREFLHLNASTLHFEANGLSNPCKLMCANICNTSGLVKLLSDEQIDVVAANIGPHEQYGDAHLKAIELLDHLPATTFIGAGYAGLNSGSIWASDQAHFELARRGFAVREVTLDKYHAAFIAER